MILLLKSEFESHMVKEKSTAGFRVSFLVDARGGYMQARREPKIKVFIPRDTVASPTRIILQLIQPDKIKTLPELDECDGFASRFLRLQSSCPHLRKPILIEMPHIASLRGNEREIIVMKANEGSPIWKEFPGITNRYNLEEIFSEFNDLMTPNDGVESLRICKIFMDEMPSYLCLISRFRCDSVIVGQDGGFVESKVDSRVTVRFPPNAIMKNVQISLEVQMVDPTLIAHAVGENQKVTASPIVTVVPKRRKFRDIVEIQMPLPNGVFEDDLSNLRVLYSLSKYETKWKDITNSTQLTVRNNYLIHSTEISARIWLISAPGIADVADVADRIYDHHCSIPYIGRFLAFARRHNDEECQLRFIFNTEDSTEKTLELLEGFQLIAVSPEVEVIKNHDYQIETAGNLVPVKHSIEGIQFRLEPFMENRMTMLVTMRNYDEEFTGKIAFVPNPKMEMKEISRPITILDIIIPTYIYFGNDPLRKNDEQRLFEIDADRDEDHPEIEELITVVNSYTDGSWGDDEDLDVYPSARITYVDNSVITEMGNQAREMSEVSNDGFHQNHQRETNECGNIGKKAHENDICKLYKAEAIINLNSKFGKVIAESEMEVVDASDYDTEQMKKDFNHHEQLMSCPPLSLDVNVDKDSEDANIPVHVTINDPHSHTTSSNDDNEVLTSFQREMIRSDPEILIETEMLPDGRIMKRRIVKSNITITEKSSGHSSKEDSHIVRMMSNEPLSVIERADGGILKRTTTTTKTTSRLTLNELNPLLDGQCLLSKNKELNDILNSPEQWTFL